MSQHLYNSTPMEIAALLTTFLSPFLPYLLKISKPIAEEAGKKLGSKLGEGSWETAKTVWAEISEKVKEKPLAQGAAEAVGENAQDDEAKAILTKQFEKLLAANPDTAHSIQQLLSAESRTVSKAMTLTQVVKGDKNIVIGETSGSISITQS